MEDIQQKTAPGETMQASKNEERERAVTALKYIIPLLEKHQLRWCISGGFACYLYGVERPIQAIDIDIESERDDPGFTALVEEVQKYADLPFQLWIDENYDNWVTDVVVGSQTLSICDTPDLRLFNSETGQYEVFYKDGIPEPIMMEFEGLQLPIAPKESVLRMKQALAYKKPIDHVDIAGMEQIIGL